MNKDDVFVSQLEKYAKLKEGERVVQMSEDLLKHEHIRPSRFGFLYCNTTHVQRRIKCEDRRLKVIKLRWARALSNMYEVQHRHPSTESLTLDDVSNLAKLYEHYRDVFHEMVKGGNSAVISFERSEVIENVLFSVDEKLTQAVEATKNGFIPKDVYHKRAVFFCHQLLILKEVEGKIVVKEIYMPYSGIVIQLPESY